MKIQAISDTHGRTFPKKIEECDILLIGGDISPAYLTHDFYTQQQWFLDTFIPQLEKAKEKAKHIVFIAGNHDVYLYEVYRSEEGAGNRTINNALPDDVHYLCDSSVIIDDIHIFGSPWVVLPSWGKKGPPVWSFADRDEELANIFNIPEGLDILLTHGPVFRFCDHITDGLKNEKNLTEWGNKVESLGSKALFNALDKLENKPKHVLSGHIHSAPRNSQWLDVDKNINTKFACVSILDEQYEFSKEQVPLIIDYDGQGKIH